MKLFKNFLLILVIFIQTGNVLSKENIFDVNNIEIIKKTNISNQETANLAIKKGYDKLIERILLKDDKDKISKLSFAEIKELVSYYQVTSKENPSEKANTVIFNISFDKEKFHDLFYSKDISYSEILNKEFYLLPVLKKKDQYFIFNQNFFYENWNNYYEDDLIEFILPFENIEIIQKINSNKSNLLDINLSNLFQEYSKKNLALVFIEDINGKAAKIFLKSEISGKIINKNLSLKNEQNKKESLNEQIIINIKKEIINLVKSQNLIDIKTPSFLNTKLVLNKFNNLAELHKRLNKIGLVDSIYVQEFSNEYVFLKIKYLGNLEKIIKQLESEKIILKRINDEWSIKIL